MNKLSLMMNIVLVDESILQVFEEADRPATSKSYMWLYRTGRMGPPIVLYDYKKTRAAKQPIRFLEGFQGYLHVDGYAGYNGMSNVTLVGGWGHARWEYTGASKVF